MSDDGTLVRCQECGHEWETVAEYPQCSDPNDECGRSRNVEPVNETNTDDGGMSERDPASSGDSQSQSEWSPLFDAEQTETDPVEDLSFSEKPEIDDEQYGGATGDESPDFEASESAEPPELEAEDIELFVKTPFDMAARSRGDHWELSDDELSQLSVAYAKVGNKYMPYMMAEHAPEVLAVMTTVAVVGPRLATDKKQAEKEAREQTDDEPQEQGDRRSDEPQSAAEVDDSNYAWAQV